MEVRQGLLREPNPPVDFHTAWRESARKGRRLSAVAALPGMGVGLVPSMRAAKPSVVGSGPMWMPGKSSPAKYRMKVVLPAEYWPNSRTMGLASSSASLRSEVEKRSKSICCSAGRTFSP